MCVSASLRWHGPAVTDAKLTKKWVSCWWLSSALLIRWGQVAAAAALTIVPTIILFSIVQKRLVEGLTAGAIKE
ncbi:hypothetical protein D1BOALGB6SA_1119 [Olavius sp. associated proteobacterium Delta 1]|nr:hypothetical protein D1BOALGB6SA_1119 [Olavius sp. associated proteobacterium Delta 1]